MTKRITVNIDGKNVKVKKIVKRVKRPERDILFAIFLTMILLDIVIILVSASVKYTPATILFTLHFLLIFSIVGILETKRIVTYEAITKSKSKRSKKQIKTIK